MDRRRLEAEVLHDGLLALAGRRNRILRARAG
jgi:hypothetical protein